MQWLNPYGLAIIVVMMIPNLLFAIKQKNGFANAWKNKAVEALEQIGRMGCFGFMVINVPGTCLGFASEEAFRLYLIVNGILLFGYCLVWFLCFRKNSLFRALALSLLPSLLFIVSALLSRSLLLLIAAVVFAPCHILISCKNAVTQA